MGAVIRCIVTSVRICGIGQRSSLRRARSVTSQRSEGSDELRALDWNAPRYVCVSGYSSRWDGDVREMLLHSKKIPGVLEECLQMLSTHFSFETVNVVEPVCLDEIMMTMIGSKARPTSLVASEIRMMAIERPARRMREVGECSLHLRHATRTETRGLCRVPRILSCSLLGIGEAQRRVKERAAIVLLISSPCLHLRLLLVFMQASGAVAGPRAHPYLRSCMTHQCLISAHGS